MYLDHFGLTTDPFSLTPSLDFLYTSMACNETLAHLAYSLENGEAITLISGPIGIGKTLIVHSFLAQLGPTYRTALVNTTQVSYPELLKLILVDLGVEYPIGADRADLLALLRQRLLECRRQRQRVLIVIDEAQDLATETLEGVRLLTNLDQVDGRGLQIVLIGQPDLEGKIESLELAQLKQRIRVHYRLEPLTRKELAEYMQHRLRVAGCERRLFHGETLDEIYRRSGGVPRLVNILCGEALLSAFVDDARDVRSKHLAPQAAPPESPAATVEAAGVREPETQTPSAPPPPPASTPSAPSPPPPSPLESRDGMGPPPARPSPPEPRARMSQPQPREDRTGARPVSRRAVSTEPQWMAAPARRGRNRRGLMVFMSIVCLLIIVVAAWFFFWPRNGSGPELTGSNAGLPQTALAGDASPKEPAAATPEKPRPVTATAPAQDSPSSGSPPAETAGLTAGDRRTGNDASTVDTPANRQDVGSAGAPYAVHISSFREPGRAEKMCASLQAQGHRAFHHTASIQGNIWHRVYVGPFADKLEARNTIARLRDDGFDSYFLIMKMSDAR